MSQSLPVEIEIIVVTSSIKHHHAVRLYVSTVSCVNQRTRCRPVAYALDRPSATSRVAVSSHQPRGQLQFDRVPSIPPVHAQGIVGQRSPRRYRTVLQEPCAGTPRAWSWEDAPLRSLQTDGMETCRGAAACLHGTA